MKCEHCRQQMLPYLYDVLDAADRHEMAAHLDTCASCQHALKAAQEQQGMLAEAIKEDANDIVFKAPVKATPASTAPTVILPRTPRRDLFLLNRWAAAAALLLFLFGAGSVIGWTVYRDNAGKLEDAHRRLAKAREDLNKGQDEVNQKKGQSQKEIREIQKQIDSLFIKWKQEEIKERKDVEDKRAQMSQIIVNGPQVAVAGAKNSYEIEVRQDAFNQNAPPGKAGNNVNPNQFPGVAQQQSPNMQARVVDQNKNVLFQQKLNVQANNRANFDLPPDLPIKPGDQIALEFLTETPEGKSVQMRDSLKLVFPDYVTHLATDRPMYRPGETVRFRSLTLERFSLKPAQQKFHLRYRIVGPRNVEIFNKEVASELLSGDQKDALKGPGGAPLSGLGVGEFALPGDLAEGEYTLQVSEVNERFREEKRSFLVRRWQAPRLNKEVQFNRSSYGPGDPVKILVRAVPVQGQQFRANTQIRTRVVVDDAELPEQNRQTDNEGRAEFDFTLPAQILKGVGVVSVICDDGGGAETVVRNLPIVLRDLHVSFFPEGGDLIAGVPNRVYFQVRTPANRPAELQGAIVDAKKQEIVRIHTRADDKEPGVNQGLGSFIITPKLGTRYSLRIDSPIGIDRPVPLAWGADGLQTLPKNGGVVLHVPQGVIGSDGDIDLTLHNVQQPRELLVGAYCRGRMLDHKFVKAEANQALAVALQPQAAVGGVFRITVFEKLGAGEQTAYRPLAERLIYRKNSSKVDVAIESDRKTYQPGERVNVGLQAFNEKREPAPAVAMVAVVDTSVLKLRDEKTARSMPTHFLLTTEIREPEDLEYADFFLSDHPRAAESLDLLLGSQGWRRFAEQDPKRFQQAQQKARPPVFLANANAVPQFLDAERKQIEKLDEQFIPKAVDLQKKLAVTERTALEVQEQLERVPEQQAVEQAQNQIEETDRRLRELRLFLVQFGLGGALLTLLFIGFYLISVGLRRLSEGGNPRGWLISGLSLLGFLFLISLIGTFALMGEPIAEDFRFGRKRGEAFFGGVVKVLPQQQQAAPAPLVWAENDKEPADENEPAPANPIVNPDNKKQAQMQLFQDQQNQGFLNNFPNVVNNGAPPAPQGFGGDLDERQQRQEGNFQAIVQKHLGRRVQQPPVHELCMVREYAHRRKQQPDGVRRDFTETLYWQPVLVMADGKAQVQFDLSDAVTRFQVLVLSHTLDGRLGANSIEITSKLPFSVESKTPIEVTQTDLIGIPVAVCNELDKKASVQLSARVKGLDLQENADRGLTLGPNQTKRTMLHVKPNISDGIASVRVVGKTGGHGDGVERKFTIVPDGFPAAGSQSGVLENAPIEHEINLPANWLPGSLRVQAHFYPSPAAELQGGLEAMLREPVGCFEQSSSSNYPNTLILNYLKQSREANPVLEKRARQLVQSGYVKLTAFECDAEPGKRGYEWFGGTAPPHEALTAYGLLQFRDMARFTAVDDAMLKRTEQFLLDQRDGKGGFKRNPKGLDQFGRAPDQITNAYIVWALTESGVKENLDVELAALKKACKTNRDPYLLSLTALSLFNRKKHQEGIDLLHAVRAAQKEDGHIAGAQTSITGSQGHDLAVETTSLGLLAILRANRFEFDKDLAGAVRWLGKQRRGSGSFGGTQATILALKAMLAYHERQPKAMQGGELQLYVRTNQQPIVNIGGPIQGQDEIQGAARATFSPRSLDPITLSLRDLRNMQPGKNMVQLSVSGNNVLPYTLTWSYRTLKPISDPKAPVKITTKLAADKAKEGQTVKLTATIENASGKGQGMTVAVIGLPGGLAIPEDAGQLKALAQASKISAWELRGRELILYWRDLAPDAKNTVELDLVCRLPGVYRGPASRAYLYYDADHKSWVEPLNIRIAEVE